MPDERTPLWLNMDESSIARWLKPCQGNIIYKKRRHGRLRPVTAVKKADDKCCVTLIATLCEDTHVQGLLPQWVLANDHTLRVGQVDPINASLPANVRVFRKKSAWSNHDVVAEYLDAVGAVLEPFLATRQPILLLDTCNQHLGPEVFAAAAKNKIWLMYVPPKVTWLLQPCDTHCFLHLKRRLRTLQMEAASRTPDGLISTELWMQNIAEGVRTCIRGKKWKAAFGDTGWILGQEQVSPFVLRSLAWDNLPALDPAPPTIADLEHCFPRGHTHGAAELLTQAGPLPPALPPPFPPPPAPRLPRRLSRRTSEGEIGWVAP